MTRVLIVEDEALVAMQIRDLLDGYGYEVCGHVMRGEDALAAIKEASPDVVLMDVNLGPGLSGIDVAERLQSDQDVPVVFLTAYTDPEVAARAARSRSFSLLVKPFQPSALRASIEMALERRQAEQRVREAHDALSASERRYRALFEQAAVGVAEIDVHTGRLVRVNEKCASIFGFTPDALLAVDLESLTYDEDRHISARVRVERGEAAVASVEKRMRRQDGALVLVQLTVSTFAPEGGDAIQHVVIIQDITRRKEAELALEESRQLLAASQHVARIGSFRRDAGTASIQWSDELYRLFGVDRATFVPSPATVVERVHEGDREALRGWMAGALAGKVLPPLEYRVPLVDGSVRVLRSQGEPVFDATGAVVAVVGSSQDVTEARALEDQLRHAQKMEAIGALAGGIAHDFNNLLAVITAHTHLLKRAPTLPEALLEHVEEIDVAAKTSSELVRQILAFARRQPSRRVALGLATVIEEAAKLLRSTLPATIALDVRVDGERPTVLADASKMQQVLVNLCTNAWHAIEPSVGRIAVVLDTVTLAPAEAAQSGLAPGRFARLRVKDDGRGMDAATARRVFDPFFTTKPVGKGSGLGLAVVHGIVVEHRGSISVETRPGAGSTFTVMLPVEEVAEAIAPPAASAPGLPTPSPSVRAVAPRVIYIDDEASLVRVVTRLLERMGFRATGYVSALEALEALSADRASADAVVADQTMPEMSGLEVARKVRDLWPGLPVLLVSGNMVASERELAEAGIAQFLAKPFSVTELGDALARVLDVG